MRRERPTEARESQVVELMKKEHGEAPSVGLKTPMLLEMLLDQRRLVDGVARYELQEARQRDAEGGEVEFQDEDVKMVGLQRENGSSINGSCCACGGNLLSSKEYPKVDGGG